MLPLDDMKYVHLRSRRRAARTDGPGAFTSNSKVTVIDPSDKGRTASAYDHVGDAYSRYADGDGANELSASDNRFAHADTIVWDALRRAMDALREAGVAEARILDAGCGPGIWSKRIADYARRTGLHVSIIGFDISTTQLEKARQHAACAAADKGTGTDIRFMELDLSEPLPWPDGHFLIVFCNYAVLNHIPKRALPTAIAELCRVSTERVIATVRALGSSASACIIGTEQVQEYRHDPERGQLALVLKDGTQHRLSFNVYSAEALSALFAPHAEIVDVRAIDLFLSRFAPDEKWTASLVNELPARPAMLEKLKELEDVLCRSPGWIDHGTHVLVIVEPKRAHEARWPKTPDSGKPRPVASSFSEYLANQSR
jgi:SAM-dependent methyltransferase